MGRRENAISLLYRWKARDIIKDIFYKHPVHSHVDHIWSIQATVEWIPVGQEASQFLEAAGQGHHKRDAKLHAAHQLVEQLCKIAPDQFGEAPPEPVVLEIPTLAATEPDSVPPPINAICLLSQWKDKGRIQGLEYFDCFKDRENHDDRESWRFAITVESKRLVLQVVTVTIAARTKKIAKTAAAEKLVELLDPVLNSTDEEMLQLPRDIEIDLSTIPSPKQQAQLDDAKAEYDKLQSLADLPKGEFHKHAFLAIDIEVYDGDGSAGLRITEIGVAVFAHVAGAETSTTLFRINEHMHLRNKRIEDNRDNFRFGEPQDVSLEVGKQELVRMVNNLREKGAETIYVVGHSVGGDIAWMEGMGVDLGSVTTLDIALVDLIQHDRRTKITLEALAQEDGIQLLNPHNGGNDAHATLAIFQRIFRAVILEARPTTTEVDLDELVPNVKYPNGFKEGY